MFTGLIDKVIVITGAGGLIGRASVKHLVECGAKVVAVDIREYECDADWFLTYDIATREGVDLLVDDVIKRYNRIDGLVNLAYPRTADWGAKFEDILYSSWQENVDMQLNSIFFICQQFIKTMVKQKVGSIVNIASIYGVVGNDFTLYEGYDGTSPAAYSAIKGGVINFSRYLASYYGKYNIRVNCVSPGGVLDEKNQHPSFIERYSEKSPLKRLGSPEEIAPAITFLLSNESSFITGHNLMVDGGWTAI